MLLITGIPIQILQSDVITCRMKHTAFSRQFKFFEQSTYAFYPNSMLETCLTDWSLGSLLRTQLTTWTQLGP